MTSSEVTTHHHTGAPTPTRPHASAASALLVYLLMGLTFSFVLVRSEAASWYRVQEMFRFQSFHMYGLIGSAIATGMLGTWLLRRLRGTTLRGQPIHIAPKARTYPRYVLGGLMFGVGWGLSGVCPGPIFILIGSGVPSMLVVLAFALIGTWLYGMLRPHLPH